MNTGRQLWLLARGNGSGKNTFYRTQSQPLGMPFVNADILARELYPDQPEQHSYEAARLAEQIRMQLLQEGRTFCFETVFSHPSKIDFVAQAKAFGYEIVLVFIHLDSAMLNNARVAQWMEEDGHNVPEGKVNERVPRVLENVKQVLPLCDSVYLIDSSRADLPFQRVAKLVGGKVALSRQAIAFWLTI